VIYRNRVRRFEFASVCYGIMHHLNYVIGPCVKLISLQFSNVLSAFIGSDIVLHR
jgi:hypothetical protein